MADCDCDGAQMVALRKTLERMTRTLDIAYASKQAAAEKAVAKTAEAADKVVSFGTCEAHNISTVACAATVSLLQGGVKPVADCDIGDGAKETTAFQGDPGPEEAPGTTR